MEPEIIVSVLASDALLSRVLAQGASPVLADIDPQTGGLNRDGVEAHISVATRRVIVEEDHGSVASWLNIERSTGPRDIALEVPAEGVVAKWVPIAPGLRGWGEHLVEIDELLLVDGVLEELQRQGVHAKPYEILMAFERTGSGLRGRRKDYPGAAAWQRKTIVVRDWRSSQTVLLDVARSMSRQMSLGFESLAMKPVKKQADSGPLALSA